jgi:glycosyltransferase involved in cell wall biosynthesis
VRFAGRLAGAELDSAIASASVVVVPSIAGEVFGMVLAETMLRGLPIVASDLGSFVEVLGDAGLTFRVADAKGLAFQIARLLEDSTLAAELGVRARHRILDHFSLEQMIQAHARVYRDVSASTRL